MRRDARKRGNEIPDRLRPVKQRGVHETGPLLKFLHSHEIEEKGDWKIKKGLNYDPPPQIQRPNISEERNLQLLKEKNRECTCQKDPGGERKVRRNQSKEEGGFFL